MFFQQIKFYSAPVRLGFFILTLLIIWLPFAIPIYLIFNAEDSNFTSILTMGLLFIEFIFLLIFWGKYVYKNTNLFKLYGLILNRKNTQNFFKGLGISLIFLTIMFTLEATFGWVKFQTPNQNIIKLICEGLLSSLAIAFGEELLFRGWLLEELDKDYNPKIVPFLDGLIFAMLHFIKPISEIIRTFVTFPALIILGSTLVLAKRSHQNLLGICIGIHGGLVWGYYILNVGEMLKYTDKVPIWVTGIDNNPLAGIMGISFLTVLALLMTDSFKVLGVRK